MSRGPGIKLIIANAKAEAERIAAEAKTKMEDFVARRTKTAEGKIAMAEAQAVADVRAAAADAAVTAASSRTLPPPWRTRLRNPCNKPLVSMSRASGSNTPPPAIASGRMAGTLFRTARASIRETDGTRRWAVSKAASSRSVSSRPPTCRAPRGAKIGAAAKPAGGDSRNARLARESARTAALP